MRRVSKVKYLRDYSLQILFNDGEVKVVNFAELIDKGGYYFGPLKDIETFKNVSLDEFNYTICWPNGADLSPDILYEMGEDMQSEPQKNVKRRHRKSVTIVANAMTKKRSKHAKS